MGPRLGRGLERRFVDSVCLLFGLAAMRGGPPNLLNGIIAFLAAAATRYENSLLSTTTYTGSQAWHDSPARQEKIR